MTIDIRPCVHAHPITLNVDGHGVQDIIHDVGEIADNGSIIGGGIVFFVEGDEKI